ncbi:MAG: hypothetical protein M0R30_06170 [Methanoregula sp.]|uniref:hypothetical protein n=1 Tax=Methanoregula sp. TaxID=2052170 RepID=UPI0025D2FF46|nr:hypothetical protein [Methanoregula sp.]MCK9631212.1 hypothetical protein [Methanoregula sp.]
MHNGPSPRNEPALTGLEIVILLVILVLAVGYIGYGELSPDTSDTQKSGGMLHKEIVATSNLLSNPGGLYGFPAVDGIIDGTPVRFRTQDPRALGAYEITVQPFMMTTGAIDMGHASVIWATGNHSETLSLVHTPELICPNWTITRKANFIPLQGADQDILLEGSEQFSLLICPSKNTVPYQKFSITIAPANSEILPLSFTVPAGITRVTKFT